MTNGSQRTEKIKGWRSIAGLIGWIALCWAVASFGAVFKPGAWHAELTKPSWNPPNWVFAPVWSTLYTLMAISAWRVWREGGFEARLLPLALFISQLAVNGLWSWLFFGLHQPLLGFIDIAALWILLLGTIVTFWGACRLAAWLLVPYLAWITFAACLNFALWRLNP